MPATRASPQPSSVPSGHLLPEGEGIKRTGAFRRPFRYSVLPRGSGVGFDDDLDGGFHVGVQLDDDVVLADGTESAFAEDDFALFQRQAGGGEGLGNVA